MSASTPISRRLILVTGPARSGKSEWAEMLARNSGKRVVYVATSRTDPTDGEWCDRIRLHRSRRPSDWTTWEVPVELAAAIASASAPDTCILVDSLGTWLANLLEWDEPGWENAVEELLEALSRGTGEVILVAEEVGWGLVPAYPSGRVFRDRLGGLVRRAGARADSVYLVAGGHVLDLTQLGTPLPDSGSPPPL